MTPWGTSDHHSWIKLYVNIEVYSLVQWNWFSDVAWSMKIRCIQWRQRTNFTAPGCIGREGCEIWSKVQYTKCQLVVMVTITAIGGKLLLSCAMLWLVCSNCWHSISFLCFSRFFALFMQGYPRASQLGTLSASSPAVLQQRQPYTS